MQKNQFIQDIKQQVLSADANAQIILYGSRVKGKIHKESDWDFVILLDKEKIGSSDFDNIAYPLIAFGWKNGEQVSPKLYTYEDWKKRNFTPFYKNVIKEGIVL